MCLKVIVLFASFAILIGYVSAQSYGLPPYLKACSSRDPKLNECATKIARSAIGDFAKGDPSRGIPTMDPVKKKLIEVKNAHKGGLDFTLRDTLVHGTRNLYIKKMILDQDKNQVSLKSVGNLTINTKYEAQGRIYILPIDGKGKGRIDLINFKSTYKFQYVLEKRNDGKVYYKMVKSEMPYDLEGARYKFDGLFNGNRLLSESTHDLLNREWRVMIDELGPPVAEALKNRIDEVIQKFLTTVPADELLLP